MNDISQSTIEWAQVRRNKAFEEESQAKLSGWIKNLRALYVRQQNAKRARA